MSETIARAIMNLISVRSADLRTLTIRWFGGEPLLELARVLELNKFAQSVGRKRDIEFWSGITTNGFLLDSFIFEQLVSVGIRHFQISLDGMKREHNITRRSNTPGGSFDTCIRNLLSMRRAAGDFQVLLRLHLHSKNLQSILELVDYVAINFGDDSRFKIIVEQIKKYGTGQKNTLELASNESVQIVKQRLKDRLPRSRNVSVSDFDCCYAALPNHFVIRANGKIQKCTIALYDDRNDIGFLRPDGSIQFNDQRKIATWAGGLLDADIHRLQCPWKYIKGH